MTLLGGFVLLFVIATCLPHLRVPAGWAAADQVRHGAALWTLTTARTAAALLLARTPGTLAAWGDGRLA